MQNKSRLPLVYYMLHGRAKWHVCTPATWDLINDLTSACSRTLGKAEGISSVHLCSHIWMWSQCTVNTSFTTIAFTTSNYLPHALYASFKKERKNRSHNAESKKYITKCIPSVNVHIFRVISLEHFTITFRKNRKILGGACLEWRRRETRQNVAKRANRQPAKSNGCHLASCHKRQK